MKDRATKHAEDVVSGKVLSGNLHRLACQRHLRDLEKQGTPDFPYFWNEKKSESILNFSGMLTIAEGAEPKPVRLFDNQCFDLGAVMGWVKKDGHRRFRRAYVNIGLDLSSGGDLTSWTVEIKTRDGYFIDGHSYMPRGRFEEHIKTDSAPYDVWEKQGLITVTGGYTDFKNDYVFIIRDLREMIAKYEFKINAIGYDPHNADGILGELERLGAPLIQVTQSARSLNDATCDIQYLVKSGKYRYNRDNQLIANSFMNAVTVENSFGEIKIDKKPGGKNQRIDPVDAAIDAHFCSLRNQPKKIDVNEEMKRYLDLMAKK